MKRVSAALAVVSAVLLMGTASAKVPDTSATSRLRQLGIMRPEGLPGSVAQPKVSDLVEPAEGVDTGVVNAVTDALEEGTPLTGDLLAGLPPEVAEILSALPFMPAPADQLLPEPAPAGLVPELTPEPEPARPEPAQAPAPVPKQTPAPAKIRVAAGDRDTVFPGLPTTGHAGTTTGSAMHVDALTAGTTQLSKVDEAFSASTFTSSPIAKTLINEMERVTSQALGTNSGFGRGSGLEIGLGQESTAEPQLSSQRAEAKSPPSTELITKQVGPVNADPLARASALLGQAQSRAAAACTTGVDLSFGRGYAADGRLVTSDSSQLIGTASPTPPGPAAMESRSGTRLVPQANPDPSPTGIARFGLQSETRQVLAPVTIGQLTLKFGGEWVLRAVADGKGVGDVFYGAGTVEPSAPLLTILDGTNVVQELGAQDIFGGAGFNVTLPGLAEIAIGENPRAIGGATDSSPTETSTYAAGAVDVARVTLLDGTGGDIRIGHMEAAVAVPAGGIICGIGLQKAANPELVRPGDTFTWNVTVTNPNDCILTALKVVDTISADPGIKWTVVGSDPKADTLSTNSVVWNDVGPLNPGASKELTITSTVDGASGGGLFHDVAVATGVCGPAAGAAAAEAGVGVPLEARVSLDLPQVVTQVLAEAPLGELPRTGGLLATLPAFALLATGLMLRRMKGRH
ncbi:MAG: hypothetical protein ACRD0C_12815 [Acidimicrobiia bacterium]